MPKMHQMPGKQLWGGGGGPKRIRVYVRLYGFYGLYYVVVSVSHCFINFKDSGGL